MSDGNKRKVKRLWRSRKALSPVVAAIILVAVTVAVSIAVASWMGRLTFTFMGYKELEIAEVRWEWDANAANRIINLTVSNTGTRDVTIHHIEVNYKDVPNGDIVTPSLPRSLTTNEGPITVRFKYAYSNGTRYDITIVTSDGYKFTGHFTGGEQILLVICQSCGTKNTAKSKYCKKCGAEIA